jgi:mannose-6-phosphate isomerase-like protein (cupin superfamily)
MSYPPPSPRSAYPPPKYDGEPGLVNARLRRADTAFDVRNKNGVTADYLATGASTNGCFGLYRWNMSAVRSGPDPHFHRSISESFFVISGSIKLFDGREWIDGRPGDFLFVPEGGIHGFRNESGEDASMLILFAPGAPREDYFETLARVSMGESMTDEERTAFMLRHDTFWV